MEDGVAILLRSLAWPGLVSLQHAFFTGGKRSGGLIYWIKHIR